MKDVDWDSWVPTPENVNALPEKLRQYVMSLETSCDPAGLTADNTIKADQVRALEVSNRILRDQMSVMLKWRDLGMKFDRQRMSFRWLLQKVLVDPWTRVDAAVLKEIKDAIAQPPVLTEYSYEDVEYEWPGQPRKKLFDEGYAVKITCSRMGGWEVWSGNGLQAGEYHATKPLRLWVGGVMICGGTQHSQSIARG